VEPPRGRGPRAAAAEGTGRQRVTTRSDVHAIVAARLRADGQRYTESRRKLVEILAGAERPLSIPDVLAAEPSLPQSSAYRNLVVLEQAGTVGRILAPDGALYELAEGLRGHHHHLVCLSCGAVTDVTLSSGSEQAIETGTGEVAAATGFQPTGHRLDIVGVCARCAALQQADVPPGVAG
jgi:Fur family ferric uptake transcriptional regulator